MKIVIATGIFPPEGGGPATYAEQLGRRFSEHGHEVVVVTYASRSIEKLYPFRVDAVVRGNPIWHRLRYLARLVALARDADYIVALDWFAAGVPVLVVSRLFGCPYLVRVGGDFFWEHRYLPSGAPPLSLRAYYESGVYDSRYKGTLSDRLIRAVFRSARRVIFNSSVQHELYVKYMGVSPATSAVIENPLPKLFAQDIIRGEPTREFVYWGRLTVMKNIDTLIRAFAHASLPGYTLACIGDGPERHRLEALAKELGVAGRISFEPGAPLHEILIRVKDARAFVLPSWTDISPNQVAEALVIGLPVILTRENFLPAAIHDNVLRLIDPASEDDIARALEECAQDTQAIAHASRTDMSSLPDWDRVAQDYLGIMKGGTMLA